MSTMIDTARRLTAVPERTSDRRRWIALAVLCLGQLMMVLDATIVNVALPSIQDDLHFSQSSLTWVINGYLITFGGLLLLAGRLGDLVGRKRVFLSRLTSSLKKAGERTLLSAGASVPKNRSGSA